MALSKLLNKNGASKSMFNLIWEDIKKPLAINFYLILLYKIISTLQIISLMLEISMHYSNNTGGKWQIHSITRVFIYHEIHDFTQSNAVSSTVFAIYFIATWAHYILLICVFVSTKVRIPILRRLSKVLKHIMLLHQYVLFLPIHMFMISIIKSCTVYSSPHNSLMITLASVIVIMNFAIGILNLRCYSSLYAQKAYNKRNSVLSALDLLYKIFISICIVFIPFTLAIKWVCISVTVIYSAISHYKFHTQLPFFQIKVLKAYCYLIGTKIAMTVSIFFTGIFDEFRTVMIPDLPCAAFLFILFICVRGQSHRLSKTVIRALMYEERHYKKEDDVFVHLISIRYLFKHAADVSIKQSFTESTKWNMQFNGVIMKHNERCISANCPCRTLLEIDETFRSTGAKRDKFKELETVLMRNIYEKGAEVMGNSELILLNLAQFYLLYLENYLKSYLVLQAFEKKAQKSFETEVLVEYLKKRIQERMELKLSGKGIESVQSNHLNVTALVQNDTLFIQLRKLVHEQAVKQLKFWDLLDNFELNAKNIETCCEEVDVIRNKIEKLWDSLSRINQKCTSHYLLYGLYQTLVNNTVKKGERSLHDYSRMQGVNLQEKEGITNDNLYDTHTVVIRISMRRDKIGMIEECSGDVEPIFGYQGSELSDSNVAMLMSNFFKERHHTFVMNHFEKGTENVLNRQKNLFGYHKEGHIFPIFLYVSIYPNIEKGLSYMGIIRTRKAYNNYILVKHDGTVDSYSPEIAEYLGLESRKKYNIVEICPEFEKIQNAYNYTTRTKYDNLKEDLPEYKADALGRRALEQPKFTGDDAQKLMVETIYKAKKETDSMNSAVEDADKDVSSTVEHTTLKNREKNNSGIKAVVGKTKVVQKKLRRLNTEDIDEYKKTYEQLSISGSVLSFLPQKDRNDGQIKNFLCTVADEVFDYSILRIITLGRNDENAEGGKGTERARKQLDREGSLKDITLLGKDLLTNLEEEIGISKFPNHEDNKTFKNPFVEGEEADANNKSSNRSTKYGKGALLKLLKTSHDHFDEAIQITVPNKSALFDTKENSHPKHVSINSEIREVDHSHVDEEKFDTAFNESRDFIQEIMQPEGQFNQVESSTGTNITTRGGIISKFEALLYKKEETKVSNKFKSYFIIILACILMAVFNTWTTGTTLKEGSQKVQRLLSVGQRVNALLTLNFDCRIMYLYLNNYIATTRHQNDQGTANYPLAIFRKVKSDATILVQVNTAVMNDIYELHADSQPKLFSNPVELTYPTAAMEEHNVGRLNTFEAVHTLSVAAFDIGSVSFDNLTTETDNINYILLNSMNELYLEIQNEYKIYEDDLEETLEGTQSVTWGIAIGVVSFYLMFLVIIIRDLTNTHQDKIRFWNSLIKLDILKSMGHRKLLVVIKENFENSSSHAPLKKALIEAKKQENKEISNAKAAKAKDSQVTAFKRLKSYKLKNRSYFTILPFLVVLTMIILFFILTEVLVAEEMEGKRVYMHEIKQSEYYYEVSLLTLNGLYQFISEGPTSRLEGDRVTESIDQNLAVLAKLADFTSAFMTHPYFDPKTFIQDNICNLYTVAKQRTDCTAVGQGLLTQGLVGTLTYATGAMSRTMDYARNSDRSLTSIQMSFNRDDLLVLETALKYISDGFQILTQSLADSESREQDSFSTVQIVVLMMFIVILLGLNYLMVWKGFKRLDRQKFDNMKILRVIPTPMILESKMLKTYLLKSFKDDLSSIKNKL